MSPRVLYLVRHGQADGDTRDSELTDRGRAESQLLADRLRQYPVSAIHHGPSQRATATAKAIAAALVEVPLEQSELLADAIPSMPTHELLASLNPAYARFLSALSERERVEGPAQMAAALQRFARPAGEDKPDTHEVLVTHNFIIGGFVAHALGAEDWRWLTLTQDNCGLTRILYRGDRPPSLVGFNDVGHLRKVQSDHVT